MGWLSSHLLTRDDRRPARALVAKASTLASRPAPASQAGLGSAIAGAQWSWSTPVAAPTSGWQVGAARGTFEATSGGSAVMAPRRLLASMAEAARMQGRSESDVWVEAAREWLSRRERADEPPPAAPACVEVPATTLRTTRVWGEIDALLQVLRAPASGPLEGAPAA